jgi:hypothetical protein
VNWNVDGAMQWFTENWYVFWGIGGAILAIWLHSFSRRHTEKQFASHWERVRYAGTACAVLSAIAILLNGVSDGFFGIELFSIGATPYVVAAFFVISWFVAPYLRRILPSNSGEA